MYFTALSLMLASPATITDDREPVVLDRVGKWAIHYDQDACHLQAQFGTGDDQLLARFTRYAHVQGFDLLITGKRVFTSTAQIDARLRFGAAPRIELPGLSGRAAGQPVLIFNGLNLRQGPGPRNATREEEQAASSVTVDVGLKRPFQLVWGPLDKPMDALRACTLDLIRSWGYDPEAWLHYSRHVVPIGSRNWILPKDFPGGAANRRYNGQVQYRLDIAPDGKPASCRVLFRTDPDKFADATCEALMRRARFIPALDAKGTPVRSFYVSAVSWNFAPPVYE
ncbi:TonB family protein [Sphingomonas sp.]|jgi:TonB family protein|uniref:TonB family protein n=1 Tax=Sphingomonas sp. TaxID=28214 RepID=UPI002EDA0716